MASLTVPFILLGVTQYYCYKQSEYRAESIFLVCSLFFVPPVSYSAIPLQSIDCFCSSRQLIASLLARFVLVNCSCSYSCQFRFFSLSIVYALQLARSASVHRLFLLYSSIIGYLLAIFTLVHQLFLLF